MAQRQFIMVLRSLIEPLLGTRSFDSRVCLDSGLSSTARYAQGACLPITHLAEEAANPFRIENSLVLMVRSYSSGLDGARVGVSALLSTGAQPRRLRSSRTSR